MTFRLLHYSSIHYGRTVPEQRNGKFIQVRHDDTEFLVLSPRDLTAYHANIAERFFSEQGVAGSTNAHRTDFRSQDAEWEIVGGGSWEQDESARTLRLFGSSQAYGQFDRRGLAERIGQIPEFRDYRLTVE